MAQKTPTLYISRRMAEMREDSAAAIKEMAEAARRHGLELVNATLAVPNGIVATWGVKV